MRFSHRSPNPVQTVGGRPQKLRFFGAFQSGLCGHLRWSTATISFFVVGRHGTAAALSHGTAAVCFVATYAARGSRACPVSIPPSCWRCSFATRGVSSLCRTVWMASAGHSFGKLCKFGGQTRRHARYQAVVKQVFAGSYASGSHHLCKMPRP